ncbi:glycosyltransferase family 25 protein [Gigaspora margarita]|uniref:Glycosyltransferase family 25 protein n=1 Tax=Gigaspora margarita TaxID=4874 RepID=A0A8H4A1Q9_GIGMA|nr:glycosyltransferase family 25 protein [Gigaspora margarita]
MAMLRFNRYMVAIMILAVFTYASLWFSYVFRPIPMYQDVKKHYKHLNTSLGFDHVYVISSSTQTNRRQRMKQIAKKIGLEFEFFPAISPDDTKVIDEFKFDDELDQSHKASYVNHYKIYQSIAQNKFEDALILDDNLDFELNISSIMLDVHKILPADWELLHLTFCNSQEGVYSNPIWDSKNVSPDYKLYKTKKTYCANAYAVSSTGASKLLKSLKPSKLSIEYELTKLIQSNDITSYTILPPPIVPWRSPGKGNYGLYYLKKSTLNLLSEKSKPLNSTLGFDNIYAINLSGQPDKREKLESMAEKLNLKLEFSTTISANDFDSVKKFNPTNTLIPSETAHYLNHYMIYQSIVDHGYDSALILEDDIDFELDILSIMTNTHRNLPADWEILYLGHCSELEGDSNALLPDNNDEDLEYNLFKSKKPYCTYAYAVSYVGAIKMLQKLGKPVLPIDLGLVDMVDHEIITSYTIVPPVISRWRVFDESDKYPNRKNFDIPSLKHSTLYSLGLTFELNSTLGFEHIYVINLKTRTDRRKKLEALAGKFNLNLEFFPAVSKDDEEAQIDPNTGLRSTHKACYLSHYRIYKSIEERGYESALILEDDIDLELSIASIMTNIHRIVPSNWELLYLGFCSNWEGSGDPIEDKINISPSHKLYNSNKPYCTHAYAISRAGIQNLLGKLTEEVRAPIDLELVGMVGDKKINSYTIMPPLITQWRSPNNPSDISPGQKALDFYFLKYSALHYLGLLKESNTTFGFNFIYVVNHPDRTDRLDKVEQLSTRLFFDKEIWHTILDNNTYSINELNPNSELIPSVKAHYVTHYNIYKSIIDRGYGSALILEDDIDLELSISTIITDVHQSLPDDWELLYLGHCNNLEGKSSKPIIVNKIDIRSPYKLFKSEKPYCTYAYAVSRAGAYKLVEALKNPTKYPIDQEFVNLIQTNKINSYTLIPPLVVHWHPSNESPTDISPVDQTSDFYALKNSTIKFIS